MTLLNPSIWEARILTASGWTAGGGGTASVADPATGDTLGIIGMVIGPQRASLSELFGISARCIGAPNGVQCASIFAASLTPIIRVALPRAHNCRPVRIDGLGSPRPRLVALLVAREASRCDPDVDHSRPSSKPLGSHPARGIP